MSKHYDYEYRAISCEVCCALNRRAIQARTTGRDIEFDRLVKSAAHGCEDCQILERGLRLVISDPNTVTSIAENPMNLHAGEEGDKGSLELRLWTETPSIIEFFSPQEHHITGRREYAIGRGFNISSQPILEAAFRQTETWMETCEKEHDKCVNSVPSQLPTRVLDLDQDKLGLSIVLIETRKVTGRYMTLSHCWGTVHPLTTTAATISKRMKGIQISDLPQVFRHAVTFTKGLGVRYLWIDSLCIIQGDPEDWAREVGMMAEIYANSYLNIAAAGAKDSHGQIFINEIQTEEANRRIPNAIPVDVPKADRLKVFARLIDPQLHRAMVPGENGWREYYFSSTEKPLAPQPLFYRAWILQERLLSPRNIYFHPSEMVWDCRSQVCCECGHLDHQPTTSKESFYLRPSLKHTSLKSLKDQWLLIVESYSRLQATKKNDKLPALSGLAALFAPHMRSSYLAGIWESDLARSLLWKIEDQPGKYAISCRSKPYRAPTWSWASVDLSQGATRRSETGLPAHIFFLRSEYVTTNSQFRIINAECEPSTENPFGEVAGGMIVVEGPTLIPQCCRMSWNCHDTYLSKEIGWKSSIRCELEFNTDLMPLDLTSGKNVPKSDTPGKRTTDFKLDIIPGRDVGAKTPTALNAADLRCLFVSSGFGWGENEAKTTYHFCLLLKSIDAGNKSFERIAVGAIDDDDGELLELAKVSTLNIF